MSLSPVIAFQILFSNLFVESATVATYNNYGTNWPVKAPDEAIFNVEPTAKDKGKHLNIILITSKK